MQGFICKNLRASLVQALQTRGFNANRCVVTTIRRQKYLRQYPTCLLLPDGSSLTFRHNEPRAIIKMPLTLEDCSTDSASNDWKQRRKRMDKVEILIDTLDVAFDKSQYLRYIKK